VDSKGKVEIESHLGPRWLSDLEISPRVLARMAHPIRAKTLSPMPRIQNKGRELIGTWPTVLSIPSQDGRDLLAVLRCTENPFHHSN
jgi:hypothetical protein